jgi:hypothetical protein
MNIFVLSKSPIMSAKWQCDKHVVKMPTETGQMLSTALIINGAQGYWKPCHLKHPCTIWAAQTRANFDWLIAHGYALCNEYTNRYGKTHGALAAIQFAEIYRLCIPEGKLTPFPLAMPDERKQQGNVVQSYRNYYLIDKRSFATWKINKPNWYN